MIILQPTETLRAVLAAAPATTQPTFSWAYADNGSSVALGSAKGALSGTTPVDMVATPNAGYQRVVRSGYVYNGDTAAVALTLDHFDGATARPVLSITLQPGYTLAMGDDGFRVTDATGADAAPGAPPSGDITFTTTAKSNVTGGSVVAIDPANGAYNPNLSVPADVAAIAGIAKGSANTGDPVTVLAAGDLSEVAWGWSQGPIYCGASGGALTQTAPTSGALVPVAVATSATHIQVGLKQAFIL